MGRERTGTAILDGKRWIAVVTIPAGHRKGQRVKYRLRSGITAEEAKAEAFRLSNDPNEIAKLSALPKRKRKYKPRVKPEIHGKQGRAMRTETGRTVFHQHVVAVLIDKTAKDLVRKRKRADIYDVKGCDGTDPIVQICDVMRVQLVSTPLQYVTEACE